MIIILESNSNAALIETLRGVLEETNQVHVFRPSNIDKLSAEDYARMLFRAMSPALTFNEHVIFDTAWLNTEASNKIRWHHQRMLERCAWARGGVVLSDQQLAPTSLPVISVYGRLDGLVLLKVIADTSTYNPASGGGAFKEGNTLLLCDKGPKFNMRYPAVTVPFVNFSAPKGPANMLCDYLALANLNESDLYWINTNGEFSVPINADFIVHLKPKKIFALGNNAAKWAEVNNVAAIKMPSPLFHFQNYPNSELDFTIDLSA